MCLPQKRSGPHPRAPVNVTSSGNRVCVHRCNQVEMRSHWIKVTPRPQIGVFIRREKSGCRNRGTERKTPTDGRDRRYKRCIHKPRSVKHCQRPPKVRREARDRSPSRGNQACPHSHVKTCSLQSHGRTHFCCFKPPDLWSFVLAALGSQCRPYINTLLIALFFLFYLFFGRAAACGVLVPQPGMELMPPALEAVLTAGPPGMFCVFFKIYFNIKK